MDTEKILKSLRHSYYSSRTHGEPMTLEVFQDFSRTYTDYEYTLYRGSIMVCWGARPTKKDVPESVAFSHSHGKPMWFGRESFPAHLDKRDVAQVLMEHQEMAPPEIELERYQEILEGL